MTLRERIIFPILLPQFASPHKNILEEGMSGDTHNADLSSLRINRNEPSPRRSRQSPGMKLYIPLALVAAAAILFLFRGSFSSPAEVEVGNVSLMYPSQANAVLTASGYVVAQRKASVASKATGRLVFLGVEEGDRVIKGQIVARIEDQDVLAELERYRADLEIARADSLDALRSLDRQRALFGSDLTSKADLDAAEARFRRVEASIRSAKAAVRSAEVALENTRIRAPFDGTVLTKDADVGEVVAPFASSISSRGAVVTMADMSSLEVEADVSESNITRVSAGQPCEIVLDAYPENRYPGTVHKIVPTADRAKATVLTKVRFKERDERVLPEMSAKVTFLSKQTETSTLSSTPKLTVASSAVVKRDDRDVVLLVRNETIAEMPVTVGEKMGARIEVKEGLVDQDVVVLRPTPELVTGVQVKIKK